MCADVKACAAMFTDGKVRLQFAGAITNESHCLGIRRTVYAIHGRKAIINNKCNRHEPCIVGHSGDTANESRRHRLHMVATKELESATEYQAKGIALSLDCNKFWNSAS